MPTMLQMRAYIPAWFAVLTIFASAQPLAEELETVSVSYTEVPRVYRLDGVIEAVNKTTVSAQISGQVETILFDVDDYVEKDQVIIRLNDKQPASRLKQAKAEIEEASARLKEAEDEYRRVKGVFEKEAVSKKTLDAAEASMKAAQAKLKSARAGLEQAQQQFDYTRVRAPYSGIVTERHIEVGEMAQPGMKLMSGLSLEELRVNVDVPQSMINAVRESDDVFIETPQGKFIPVTNKTVFPYAERSSHTFRVRLELTGDDLSLFPGMFVKAGFTIGQQPVLVVPANSIVRRSEVTAVYVRSPEGDISLRAVRTGRQLENGNTIILAGLLQGEIVFVDPMAAGSRLKQQYATKPVR
jgi:RND family efflux transporter MFP subunit